MGYLFVIEGLADASITAIDITLLKAKGSVWHKSSMEKKGELPCPGIDTDARWGYSHTKKGWVFGYKLHLTSTTTADVGKIVVPLTAADVTTANIPDNQMYVPLTSSSSSSVFYLPSALYMAADPAGYDDKKLYEYSKKTLGIDLICPIVERYKSTSKKRIELVCFYESALGQAIYNQKRNIYRTIDRAYKISV